MCRKKFALLLCLCLVLGAVRPVYAAPVSITDYEATRDIKLYAVTGENASVSNGSPYRTEPVVGQHLRRGSVVSTYAETFINLLIDGRSTLDMYQQSQIRISSAGSHHLAISLQSGKLAMNVDGLEDGEIIECLVGPMGMRVRGTMFTLEHSTTDIVTVTMLSGSGEVSFGDFAAIPLQAGQTIRIPDTVLQDSIVRHIQEHRIQLHGEETPDLGEVIMPMVEDIDLYEMNLFTLRIIEMHIDDLMAKEGGFADIVLEDLTNLIEQREAEQQEQQEIEYAAQRYELERLGLDEPSGPVLPPWEADTDNDDANDYPPPTPTPTPRPTPQPEQPPPVITSPQALRLVLSHPTADEAPEPIIPPEPPIRTSILEMPAIKHAGYRLNRNNRNI